MKNNELLHLALAGALVTTCEWRSSIAKISEIEDDKTKEITRTKSIVHQVEMLDFKTKTDMPFELVQPCTEEFDIEKYNNSPRPFKKGERAAVEVISFAWSPNKMRYRGKGILHPLDKETAKA